MKHYFDNIEKAALKNEDYRRVVFTSHYSQLVFMSLEPGEEIGMEVHGLDQFIRVEKGSGKAILDGETHVLEDGSAIIVPAGANHNIVNTSTSEVMKLYTLYSPPNHILDTLQPTKADEREEHFDGRTSLG